METKIFKSIKGRQTNSTRSQTLMLYLFKIKNIMSRITKEIATATAIALLKPKQDALKELKSNLKDLVTDAVKANIPNEVIELWGKYPEYFRIHSSSAIICPGFGYESFHFHSLPDDNNQPKIGTQKGNKILSLSAKIEKATAEYKALKLEIEVALFAFRTYANVEKEFPEAFALLPNKVSQAVMVNIDSIRKAIA